MVDGVCAMHMPLTFLYVKVVTPRKTGVIYLGKAKNFGARPLLYWRRQNRDRNHGRPSARSDYDSKKKRAGRWSLPARL